MATSTPLFLALCLLLFTSAMCCCSRCNHHDFCVKQKHLKGCKPLCKDPKNVTADDFSSSGFDQPGNTSNPLGSNLKFVGVHEIPGLNLQALALVRIDLAVGGVVPPHIHPRASEILIVLEGIIRVGFITADLRLIVKILVKGDIFVFPLGLIHFKINIGINVAVAISAFSCESPGTIFVTNSLFGVDPRIPADVLTKALGVDENVVGTLESRFSGLNNTHA